MPVTVSYPGIYIEELPSSAHTIAAAPTSITVFVGYTHPFKTDPGNWGRAVRIYSFTDYERAFGGYFAHAAFAAGADDFGDVALAVNQFFLNGGSDAYVVAVRPRPAPGGAFPGPHADLTPPTLTVAGVPFTAREPIDPDHPLEVRVDTFRTASGSTGTGGSQPSVLADITVTYGTGAASRVETYRRVSLDPTDALPKSRNFPNYVAKRLGSPAVATGRTTGKLVAADVKSALVTVPSLEDGTFTYPNAWDTTPSSTSKAFPATPGADAVVFAAGDFTDVMEADTSLDKVAIFNLLVLPGLTEGGILSEALSFCERKQAFLIMDPPRAARADANPEADWVGTYMSDTAPKQKNGALYFPYLRSDHPLTGEEIEIPPSGTVAGVFARTDLNRGVWKAPAGLETTTLNVVGVTERGKMNDPRHGALNLLGVNCLRQFPGIGTVVFGARTSVSANPSFEQWKYVPVRRMALFLEQTLLRNLGWVVFEPNDEPLWTAVRTTITAFMLGLFRQGAFAGGKPSDAFQVKCDAQTTTPADQANGIVNIVVAFAPLRPAEFVIVKIAQLAGQAEAET